MCFLLYAGTIRPIPRRAWRKDAPDLCVASLSDRDAPVKTHFTTPEVQCIGSTSGCGCDFPHAMLQNGAWPELEFVEHVEENPEQAATHSYHREALVELLRASEEHVIELYGIWDGDFATPPQARETIAAEEILAPTFLFKERGFYKVTVKPTAESTAPD